MSRIIDELNSSLKHRFRGELLRPGDAAYEQARVIWNGMVAKNPGLIARCTAVADVQAAI